MAAVRRLGSIHEKISKQYAIYSSNTVNVSECSHSKADIDSTDLEDVKLLVEIQLESLFSQAREFSCHKKQFENLLALSFNTEMVSQGQTVTRLNFSAFTFLPLSFVATLFGITKISVSAAWYPLWAFVTLLVVGIGHLLSCRLPFRQTGCKFNTKPASQPKIKTEGSREPHIPPHEITDSNPAAKLTESAPFSKKPTNRFGIRTGGASATS
ncbi:hypothetical protein BCR34DRAFT_192449 [Clohesyomyces aquaticus]|uniref:Uncharacterized protein n=1 Tax=Clohesyomyces aquaticus TaxID=1231657 RepID=A0A1Y1ZYE7_9PLEO|nr:hypothetical protein BCR34DRAFT_192449 [Clohesyomyces aquaticus]